MKIVVFLKQFVNMAASVPTDTNACHYDSADDFDLNGLL